MALRIFVEACLSVPQDKRRQGPVLLPRQTLREFLAGLYPDGHREWRKGKNLASLLGAIEALESSAARIPWQDETGRGGARRVVIPRDVPRSGHLDDYIQFAVDLPPRSGAQQGEAMSKDKREDDVKKRVREETEPIEHSYAPRGRNRRSQRIQGDSGALSAPLGLGLWTPLQPCPCGSPALHALQFLQGPSDPSGDAGDGCEHHLKAVRHLRRAIRRIDSMSANQGCRLNRGFVHSKRVLRTCRKTN